MPKMKAAIFAERGRIVPESRPVPVVGPLDALLRISTTICGTDVDIQRGEYRVRKGLIGRADLGALVTHRFKLDQIELAYDLFGNQRDGVLKVAIAP